MTRARGAVQPQASGAVDAAGAFAGALPSSARPVQPTCVRVAKPGGRDTTVVITVSAFLKSRYSVPSGPPMVPYSMSMNTKLPGCSSVIPGLSASKAIG